MYKSMHAAPMGAHSLKGCSAPDSESRAGSQRLRASSTGITAASAAALCCFQLVLISGGCQLTPQWLPFAGSCQSGTASCSVPPPVAVQVGPGDHVICALSGGVDSTVAATLVHKVLGDRLHCVFVDNGLLRYKVRWCCAWAPAGPCLSQEDWADTSGVAPGIQPVLATVQCLPHSYTSCLQDGAVAGVPSSLKVQVTACQPPGPDFCRRQSV